jgi:hypothetical protein
LGSRAIEKQAVHEEMKIDREFDDNRSFYSRIIRAPVQLVGIEK